MRVFGVLGCTLMFKVEGIGWVILLWSDEVRLGIGKGLSSPLVTGRSDLLSEVRGRTKDGWVRSDGGISSVGDLDGRRARKPTAAAVAALALLAAAPSDEDEGDMVKRLTGVGLVVRILSLSPQLWFRQEVEVEVVVVGKVGELGRSGLVIFRQKGVQKKRARCKKDSV